MILNSLISTILVGASNLSCGQVFNADFNMDGKIDLATVNPERSSVSVYLGNGNGTFQSRIEIPLTQRPVSATTLDLNGDAILDIVVKNDADSIVILMGNGDGTFYKGK